MRPSNAGVVWNNQSIFINNKGPSGHLHCYVVWQCIVSILVSCAKNFVPWRWKAFYKFWWDAELISLKEAAVDADKLWKTAGNPRYGPIFDKRQTTRMHYRKRLRQGHDTATEYYTNELHDALLSKQGPTFWKCWKSKFDLGNNCTEVDGCVDVHAIAEKFATYFEKCYSCNNVKHKNNTGKRI